MLNVLQRAKEMFSSPEDQEMIAQQTERAEDLEAIAGLMADPRSVALKRSIKQDIEIIMVKLFATKDVTLVSDLEANFKLLNKLRAEDELMALEAWLNEKVYGDNN